MFNNENSLSVLFIHANYMSHSLFWLYSRQKSQKKVLQIVGVLVISPELPGSLRSKLLFNIWFANILSPFSSFMGVQVFLDAKHM
jgi:hypothetical protein